MTDEAPNPVYISVGHKIALDTAVKLALSCAMKRVPEPIRQVSNHYIYAYIWGYSSSRGGISNKPG